jgi:hypothetical protein
MGRTSKFNASGGRDHWGGVFPFVMAGAGVRTGQVYGASDVTGSFPVSDRMTPSDLAATVFHLLGIRPEATFPDPAGRPHHVTNGQIVRELLG